MVDFMTVVAGFAVALCLRFRIAKFRRDTVRLPSAPWAPR